MLHQHFPAHSTSALTSYPLTNFPVQQSTMLLTTLLNKKAPDETQRDVMAALHAVPVDPRTEELWARAAEVVAELQEARDWIGAVVTAEEAEAGTVREEDWVIDRGDGAGEMVDSKRDMATMLGVLRFCETGVPVAEQVPLPTVKPRVGGR